MSETIVTGCAVEVEELTAEQGRDLLERSAREAFGVSWGDFYEMYLAGKFTGTPDARVAEELAFLSPLAG